METTDLVIQSLLALPERISKLECQVFEQQILLSMLLNRSGLDEAGILRAFDLASSTREKITAELSGKVIREWHQTPEGKEARERTAMEVRRRQKELWREACLEDGRIFPDPTATEEA